MREDAEMSCRGQIAFPPLLFLQHATITQLHVRVLYKQTHLLICHSNCAFLSTHTHLSGTYPLCSALLSFPFLLVVTGCDIWLLSSLIHIKQRRPFKCRSKKPQKNNKKNPKCHLNKLSQQSGGVKINHPN